MLYYVLDMFDGWSAAPESMGENLHHLGGQEFGLELLELAGGITGLYDSVAYFAGVEGDTAPITFTNFRKRHSEFDIHSCLGIIYIFL